MEHLIRKVSSNIGVLYRSSKKLSTDAKRQYYLSARVHKNKSRQLSVVLL